MRGIGDPDVTAPRSPHSVHVADRDDIRGVDPWSRDTLYRAVRFADDGEERVVVLDYGRAALYLAAGSDLTYRPPRALGLRAPPALRVAAPVRYDPDGPRTAPTETDALVVSPEFDVLVPAFDADPVDEDDLPPLDPGRTRSSSHAGVGAGTPG